MWEGTHNNVEVYIKCPRVTNQTRNAVEKVSIWRQYTPFVRTEGHSLAYIDSARRRSCGKVEPSEYHSFHWLHANPLQSASERMPNGTLTECISKNPLVNRIDPVSLCPAIILPLISSPARCCRTPRLSSRKTYHKQRLERGRCSLRIIWAALLTLYQSNVLVGRSGHARLTDFGFSTVCGLNPILVTDAQGYTPRCATPKAISTGDKIREEQSSIPLAWC